MTDGDGSADGGEDADPPAETPDDAVDTTDPTERSQDPDDTGDESGDQTGGAGSDSSDGGSADERTTADGSNAADGDDGENGDTGGDGSPDSESPDTEADGEADGSDETDGEDSEDDDTEADEPAVDEREDTTDDSSPDEDDKTDGDDQADEDDGTGGDGQTEDDEGAGEDGEVDGSDLPAAGGRSGDGTTDFEADPGTETAPPDHAPDDEEMPLADHVEEMVRRLGIVLVLMAGISAVIFPFGEQVINVIWYSFLPGTYDLCPTTSPVPRNPAAVISAVMVDVGAGPGVTMAEASTIKPACPRVYQPLATIFARLKVSTLAGFVVALPAFVYETYLFMRPGLYPRERRYYLAAVPTSLILAAIGVAFAYLLVLPAIFTYFLYYSEGAADIAFGLTETFDLMVLMMGFFAAIFQIPLFIMLAIMMGVTTRQWLADRRLLFWAAFAGIAFIFNPDPTGMAPFIVAATMIVLFEGTLLLLSWTGSEGLLPAPEAVAARRPYAWVLAGVAGYLASDAPLPTGYYEALPGVVRWVIESNDLIGVTPLVVGGALIALYEAAVFVLRRYLPVGAWRRKLFTGRVSLFELRRPVWLVAILVGYLASPAPFLLDRARAVTLPPAVAAGLAVGLIVAFEVGLAVWRYLRPEEAERLPLER